MNKKLLWKQNMGPFLHILFFNVRLVKIHYESENESLILKIVNPRNLIGLNSLQKNENIYNFTTSSYIDSMVKLTDINLFKHFITENGRFAAKIINILSENTNQINSRFFGMTHHQSFGKLADLLLCLAGRIFKKSLFELQYTCKELAELAGISTESMIRVLEKFLYDKLIRIKGKIFEILNADGLQRICDLD